MALFACEENNPVANSFIPSISNIWVDEKDSEHEIFIQTDEANTGVPKGVFTGQESHYSNPDLNGNALDGKFKNFAIEFTIHRSSSDITYKGKIDTTGIKLKIRTAAAYNDSLILVQP